jgi:hypothetical protein
MLGTLPETRWLASLIGVSGADTGTPVPDEEVRRAYVMNAESRFLAKVPEEGQSCDLPSG